MILKKPKPKETEKLVEKIRNPKGAGRKPTGRRRRVFFVTDFECDLLRRALVIRREAEKKKKEEENKK